MTMAPDALPFQILRQHDQPHRPATFPFLVHLVHRAEHFVADAELRRAALYLGRVDRQAGVVKCPVKVGLQAGAIGLGQWRVSFDRLRYRGAPRGKPASTATHL